MTSDDLITIAEPKFVNRNGQAMKLLKLAKSRAFCPYSNFPVGCVIEMTDGSFVLGCNVENASYSITICAERSAIASAISQGYKPEQMEKFYVITKLGYCVFPCGSCRSAISEMNPQAAVVVVNSDASQSRQWTIAELLPQGFSSKDLEISKGL